ncbi:MAG: hypothetical protein LBS31_02640 [Candidatus Adiutrix sp.]|jgi:hypothetical protein|nr:hypothetical protein [Candidatus Adiutrix sp.]
MSRHKFFLCLCCLCFFALALPAGPALAQIQDFLKQRQRVDPPSTPPEARPDHGPSGRPGERPDRHDRRPGLGRAWQNQPKPLTHSTLSYGMKPTDPLQYGIIPNRVISPGAAAGPGRRPPRRPERGGNLNLNCYSNYGCNYYYNDGYYNYDAFYSGDSPDRNIFEDSQAPASYFEVGGPFERFETEYDQTRLEERSESKNTAPKNKQSPSEPRSSGRADQAGQSDLDWYNRMSKVWR